MSEPAGVWIRVSTKAQDEKSQVPDVEKHCDDHDYVIARRYELNDKSASKGEQQDALNQVIADMAAGVIKVLVCWHSDRLDRRGPKAGYAFLYAAELVDGRIESVLDPEFGKDDVGSEVLTTIRMGAARDESKLKSERIRIANDTIDGNGAFRGRPIYGYNVVGKKHHKHLEIIESEAEIIREAVSRYLDGQSVAHIADVFNRSGRLPRPVTIKGELRQCEWSAKTLAQIMRSETIMGRHHQGKAVYRAPAIVSVRDFKAVQARLDTNAYRAGVRTRKDTALLTSILICGTCGRNMYRRPSRRRKGPAELVYYCIPRKGVPSCKMLFPLEQMDELAFGYAVLNPARSPILKETFIKGHNYQNEIDLLALEIQAMSPLDAGYRQRLEEKLAEIDRLNALPAVPDRIETVEIDLSEYAEKWASMTNADRRSVLIEHGIRIYVSKNDDGSPRLSATPPKHSFN